jgi:hypothetical protein
VSAVVTLGIECVCGDINLPAARVCEGCDRPLGYVCIECGDPLPVVTGVRAARPRKFCGNACAKRFNRPIPPPPVVPPTREQVMRQWWVDQLGEAETKRLAGELAA